MRLKDFEAPAKELLDQMTLEEKCAFFVGKDFWHVNGCERLGLPSVHITDGPHGLRKIHEGSGTLAMSNTVPSTAFPTASATASSFDPDMLYEMGKAMAAECLKEEIAVILGPGANHKRSPLCGRNFEYFSEDPYLSAKVGAALINGIEDSGVGTSLKHYALNSQERARMNNDSIADERAMQEIYLRQYENIIKDSQPTTVMTSYNRVNGEFASNSKFLMTDMARKKWGFEGLFVTDWGAVDKLVDGFNAGLDLEMPGASDERSRVIADAVRSGKVSEERLNESALLFIEMILRYKDSLKNFKGADMYKNADVAREAAEDSAILLKNEDNILPLKPGKKIGVIGGFAMQPRYQGAGSSQLVPFVLDTPIEAFQAAGIDFDYSVGFDVEDIEPDTWKQKRALGLAEQVDTVVVFAGLPGSMESEGYDRSTMAMPKCQTELIKKLAKVNKNLVVVLQLGSPAEIDWLDSAKAVLNLYLASCQNGKAAVNLLTGKVNPSGRLAETWPLKLEDNPSYGEYGEQFYTKYKESIFTGYRFYDTFDVPVRFPFGYGLSYTEFKYSNFRVSKKKMNADSTVLVSVKVENVGSTAGKEVVQIYTGQKDPTLFRAKKELRAFAKVSLEPGDSTTVKFELDGSAFDYFNTNIHDYHVATGDYTIFLCKNVSEVINDKDIHIDAVVEAEVPDYSKSAPEYYKGFKNAGDISDKSFEAVLGHPMEFFKNGKPYTKYTTFVEIADGKLVDLMRAVVSLTPLSKDVFTGNMFNIMLPDMTLRVARMGGLTNPMVQAFVDVLNKKPVDAVKHLLGK